MNRLAVLRVASDFVGDVPAEYDHGGSSDRGTCCMVQTALGTDERICPS